METPSITPSTRRSSGWRGRWRGCTLGGHLRQGVLPVLPQPLGVQARVEVVPGQHLCELALARGEPPDVDAGALEPLVGRGHPAVVGEVLAPAVETSTGPPRGLDDGLYLAVPAR